MANVKFYQCTAAKYNSLTTKDSNAFYYTTDVPGLYLGALKLSNGADLAAAVARIATNESDIDAIQQELVTLNGEATVDGSIKKLIADASKTLQDQIDQLNTDLGEAGKVDDVKVNGTSVVGEDKIANITIGTYYTVDKVANPDATIETVVTSPVANDVAIVIEPIADGINSRTAYYYNGTAWVAMDGNVNAENVYFDQDLVTTSAIGNIALSNGQATIAAAGKNLKQVFDTIFVKEKNPTIAQPSISITCNNIGEYEVGTEVALNYTVNTNVGSYSYGPATGVTFSNYSVSSNGETKNTQSGVFTAVTVGDDTNISISASADNSAGTVPQTNVGNDYAAGQIQAGSKSATKGTLRGYRKVFAGSKIDPVELTSANIRGLAYNGKLASRNFNITVSEGSKQVIIAIPTGHSLVNVLDQGAFGTDIVGSFELTSVQVEGANGYTAKAYNVYVYSPAAALGANTYKVTIN